VTTLRPASRTAWCRRHRTSRRPADRWPGGRGCQGSRAVPLELVRSRPTCRGARASVLRPAERWPTRRRWWASGFHRVRQPGVVAIESADRDIGAPEPVVREPAAECNVQRAHRRRGLGVLNGASAPSRTSSSRFLRRGWRQIPRCPWHQRPDVFNRAGQLVVHEVDTECGRRVS
jgi:hypothetical protein